MVRSSGRADLVSVGSHGHFSGIVEELLGILTDNIAATDAVLRTLDRNRLDGINLSDQIREEDVREILRLLSDPFALNDAALRELSRFIAEGTDTEDSLFRELGRTLADSADPNDIRIKELFRVVGERIQPTDQIFRDLSRLIANNVALNDTIVRALSRFFADDVDANDAKIKELFQIFSNRVDVDDLKFRALCRQLLNNITTDDNLTSERFRELVIAALEEVVVLFQALSTAQTLVSDLLEQGVELVDWEARLETLETVSLATTPILIGDDVRTEILTIQALLQKQTLNEDITTLFEQESDSPALFELWKAIIDKIGT